MTSQDQTKVHGGKILSAVLTVGCINDKVEFSPLSTAF